MHKREWFHILLIILALSAISLSVANGLETEFGTHHFVAMGLASFGLIGSVTSLTTAIHTKRNRA